MNEKSKKIIEGKKDKVTLMERFDKDMAEKRQIRKQQKEMEKLKEPNSESDN